MRVKTKITGAEKGKTRRKVRELVNGNGLLAQA